ncbi:MAG: DUF1353 domain-containing protein [Verrucomicrobiia bacterium]
MSFENCDLDANGRPILVTKSSDGRNFELVCSFDYLARDGTRYRAPIGATSDGCSTPPELWSLMGKQWLAPFGTYWPAAFIHDGAYRNWLQRIDDAGRVQTANLSKEQSDNLFAELMELLGTSIGERSAIYEGVHELGWRAFREDRAVSA